MYGTAVSGMGNFSCWIEKLQSHYRRKTAMSLFPGTLNINWTHLMRSRRKQRDSRGRSMAVAFGQLRSHAQSLERRHSSWARIRTNRAEAIIPRPWIESDRCQTKRLLRTERW